MDKMSYEYVDDCIFFNKNNQLGYEYNNLKRIRIDLIITNKYARFKEMMDILVAQAIQLGYNQVFFADSLSTEMLAMFKRFGFTEKKVCGDPFNHYLYYFINERGGG